MLGKIGVFVFRLAGEAVRRCPKIAPLSRAWGRKSFPENSGKRCRNGAEMVQKRFRPLDRTKRVVKDQCFTRIARIHTNLREQREGRCVVVVRADRRSYPVTENGTEGWRPGKFHFGQNIFVLNWALASATERKKCKKLQFVMGSAAGSCRL